MKILKESGVIKKAIVAIGFVCVVGQVNAQLFDNPRNIERVRNAVDHIYNMETDLANTYIDSVDQVLPEHPVVALLFAMNILWSNIPDITELPAFDDFIFYLNETVRLAQRLDGARQEHPEAIFFEMTAHGLMAEYYADAGNYMKAITEAGKAYTLIRESDDLPEENPEFYLPQGVYNYFREKYPERHPSYKPLLWFFKSGDAELGLNQIKEGCRKGVLTKVESYVYLAYIYLRYEELPQLAQSYLLELSGIYPGNYYVSAKYLESLAGVNEFEKAEFSHIQKLLDAKKPYYTRAGNAYMGLYEQVVNENWVKAALYYHMVVDKIDHENQEDDYYVSLSYLGLAKYHMKKGQNQKAIDYAQLSMKYAETKEAEQDAKAIIFRLE
ncbi:hypothetical protein [Marinoscillum sp. MHG1-6]|uniref:hypothetical protein n=1 Tax=Marinoscillum sp. MHG1-6 TaxID=2959627 RepID=UPI0021575A2E|nr:hypothetical protein [Marinoscillum sp. MHG1-6]